jgi:hypothetical protein
MKGTLEVNGKGKEEKNKVPVQQPVLVLKLSREEKNESE